MNSDEYFDSLEFKNETKGMSWAKIMLVAHHTHLDPKLIQLVNQLVERSQADVVVSSTWRSKYSVEELNSMLTNRGATFKIIAATPTNLSFKWGDGGFVSRGLEIQTYLNSLNKKPDSFVIIDDIDEMEHLSKYLVLTDDSYGITQEDVESALIMLK